MMADPTNEELRAIELVAQLAALSPAEDGTSVRITVRLGNGRLVGEALLSARAVEALSDSVASLNAYLGTVEDDPELIAEAALIDAEAARGANELEEWLRSETEGGQI